MVSYDPGVAVSARNMHFVGHSDMDGRGDGVQVMVHRGHAFVGHSFNTGITIIDVRDPSKPKVVNYIGCPPNTRSLHLQIHDDLLIAVNGPSVWLDPKLILIDEPSIGLSPNLVQQVFRTLQTLRDQGVTVLMVEQNAKAALAVSDYGLVLELGQTRMHDRAATLLADPRVGRLFLGGSIQS